MGDNGIFGVYCRSLLHVIRKLQHIFSIVSGETKRFIIGTRPLMYSLVKIKGPRGGTQNSGNFQKGCVLCNFKGQKMNGTDGRSTCLECCDFYFLFSLSFISVSALNFGRMLHSGS